MYGKFSAIDVRYCHLRNVGALYYFYLGKSISWCLLQENYFQGKDRYQFHLLSPNVFRLFYVW